MAKVESGMFVSVHYTGTLDGGEVFDSSQNTAPLEVQMGGGQLIQGFEDALMGMVEKDKKTFTLRPEEAYGERDETLKRSFDRSEVPRGFDPEVGQTVALHTPQGQQIPAKIVSVDEKKVTVDLNHPLAGKSLTFEIEVVGISDTPTQTPSCGSGCDCSSGCSC